MIMDALYLFDSGLLLTTSQASTNIIDLQNPRDMGIGDNPAIKLAITIGTTFLSAGLTTMTVAMEGSTDAVTWNVLLTSPATPKAGMLAGKQVWGQDMPRANQLVALPRYLRLNYIVGTGPFTAGALTAALVLDVHAAPMYRAGQVVVN